MILCGDTSAIGVGGVGSGGECPPRKDIKQQEEGENRVKNKYLTISNGD